MDVTSRRRPDDETNVADLYVTTPSALDHELDFDRSATQRRP